MLHAVIGAQFGDEGKGLLTDYLSDHLTLVVRFNGGAQAGHTVVLEDGRRHVFGHLGAGCYKAACTLLSRFFIVNPVVYAREVHAPELAGIRRTTYVDDRCLVTTPIDMMLNQLAEAKRGDARHGSCGLGINETVTRSQHPGDAYVDVGALYMRSHRKAIEDGLFAYAEIRAAALGVTLPSDDELREIFRRWWQDVEFFLSETTVVLGELVIAGSYDNVVFEGAQGLRLDEYAPGFPHVTRSRTGLTNVLTLLKEAQRTESLDVTYVTRAYVTRHGAGPLTGECEGHPFGWSGPETNVDNPHQGRLRYAPLDTVELAEAITADLRYRDAGVLRPALAVTCLDQTTFSAHDAADFADAVSLPLRFWSTGPTCKDVHTGEVK